MSELLAALYRECNSLPVSNAHQSEAINRARGVLGMSGAMPALVREAYLGLKSAFRK